MAPEIRNWKPRRKDMPHDPHLQTYMREIRRTPLLTPEQERELSRRLIRDNDPAARDAMLLANLRFVVKIARRYTRRGLDLQDLIAEGNFALLRAVEGFNPEMNDRFATYASFWIKQAIERALLKYERPFPVTCYTNKKIGKWKLAVVDVAGQLGWAPTLEELPDHLGDRQVGAHLVRAASAALRWPVREQGPIAGGLHS